MYDSTGTAIAARTTAGVIELGHGYYAAVIAFPDSFIGEVRWDTGTGFFASDILNPGGNAEYIDAKISSIIGSAGTGAFVVTVTVTDGVNPLSNVKVSMSEGVNHYTALTNISGVASFSLDAATYTLGMSKSGYSFTPVSVIVTAATNFNETMTAIVIPVPANPTLCNVFGTFVDLEGNPMAGITFTFTLSVTPPAKSGMIFGERVITASTNASGQLIDAANNPWIALARNDGITPSGSHYLVTCPPVHFNHKITLAAATFDLASLVT